MFMNKILDTRYQSPGGEEGTEFKHVIPIKEYGDVWASETPKMRNIKADQNNISINQI